MQKRSENSDWMTEGLRKEFMTMKKLLTLTALVLLLTVGLIGASSFTGTHVILPETRDTHFVPNQVDLYMPSNPTTGYSWTCNVEDPSVVAVRDQFFEDSSELGFVGAGGTHWFHISGVQPGTTSVIFRYLRSWEAEAPAEETTYRLTVDEQLNVMIWGVEVS